MRLGPPCILTALLVGVPSAALAKDGRVSIAVMDLKARGVDEAAAGALSTEVTNTLARMRVFSVISGEDVRRLLSLEETKQGCTGNADAACMAEIGGALGVELLVYGEISKLGGTYGLSLALLDTQRATAVSRASGKADEPGQLLAEAARLAKTLVQPLLSAKRGSLVLDVREAGARVEIDGQTAGVTPVGRQDLAMGPHEVRVEKKGFMVWAKTLDVLPDQVAVEGVTLVPNDEFIAAYESRAGTVRTLAWITAGTAAALLATGAAMRMVDDARFGGLVTQQYLEVRGGCADIDPSYNGSDYCPTSLGLQNDVLSSVKSIETIDTIALVALIVGASSGVASAILFLAGDPPGRYSAFEAGPVAASPKGFELRF